ncbi:unnamed protein product [Sphagnum troendelagicum]|uniref:PGG domain-containing protein n=1 Tax=Sphagnum troendelagicum TaxID=128251 RepID=A0ABP0U4T2_9BRYO
MTTATPVVEIANELYDAANEGDLREVQRILALPAGVVDANARGANGRFPLQAAAMNGHVAIVELLLAWPGVDVNATPEEGVEKKTPLHMAAEQGHVEVVKLLLAHPQIEANAELVISGLTPLHLASFGEHIDVVAELLKWPDINVNPEDKIMTRTPLHLAVERGNTHLVHLLIRDPRLRATVEDSKEKIALQLAKESQRHDIVKLLVERDDVKDYVDRLYRDRQVYVDAANAILVGAALIASVTFAGWLQPPLGLTTYYGNEYLEPYPAPPGTYMQYAAVKQHPLLQVFWGFNSASFFFAIATVIASAGAVLPTPDIFIKESVKDVRRILVMASELLVLSVICVLGAFAAAGIVSLPSEGGYNTVMVHITCWGGSVCAWLLLWFVIRVYRLRPKWWKMMEGYVKPTAVETAAPLDQSLSKQYGKAIRKQVEARRKAAKKKASPSSCSWIFNCNHHHNQ